jgi:class 3 adenylate cyclase
VASLGHRRQLLRAITELKGGETAPATEYNAPVTPHDTAERRQVTVMFSDLVGSTALSARMDPEDLREIITAYQKCVAETVQRFGGFVAKYMGDGVLIYFGYPQAHEDDAERAVRSGLELIAAVSDLKTHAALQTRVGIATRLVVAGDLIGSGASQEQAIVAIVWWDATTGHNVVNASAIGLFPVGVAVRAAGSSDTTGRVRLSGFLRRRWPDG